MPCKPLPQVLGVNDRLASATKARRYQPIEPSEVPQTDAILGPLYDVLYSFHRRHTTEPAKTCP